MMRCASFCRFLPLTGLLMLGPVQAAVLRVDGDALGSIHDGASWPTAFLTIGQALNAAQPGDEVWVAGGTYREHVRLTKPRLALYGGFAGTETARIETSRDRSIIRPDEPLAPNVTIEPEATDAVLNGFNVVCYPLAPQTGVVVRAENVTLSNSTIQGCGKLGGAGGGIVCEAGSSVTICGNHIISNTAREGGGILARDATLAILDNEIQGNTAGDTTTGTTLDYRLAARGGGILILGGTAEVRGNRIGYNGARDGAGLWAEDATLTVTHNVFDMNRAEREGVATPNTVVTSRGGGLGLRNCVSSIRNNLFAGNLVFAEAPLTTENAAMGRGGGIYLDGGRVTVANNTLVNNVASVSGRGVYPNFTYARGGGLYATNAAVVANNIFASNSVLWTIGSGSDAALYVPSVAHVAHNLFFGNTSPTWEYQWARLNGNIEGDPRFTSHYRLSPNSPAVDRGEPALAAPDDTDLDGVPRIQGARVDIGAYELAAPAAPARVYVTPNGDDANDGRTWATAKRTVQAGMDAAALDGEVWVAAGVYSGSIRMWSRVALYGGFAGAEKDREQRDPRRNETVLEGDGKSRVVSIPVLSEGATLDGFTVRNGGNDIAYSMEYYSIGGAGILCQGREATIVHNVIEDNAIDFGEDNPMALGGGLLVHGGSATIANNVIRNNTVAVYQGMSFPQFGNLAQALGGGVYIDRADITFANNVIVGNTVGISGHISQWEAAGSGLYMVSATGRVTGNTFVRNGIANLQGSALHIAGEGSQVAVSNNIVSNNSRGVTAEAGTATFDHNNVSGNTPRDYGGIADPTGTDGNIKENPRFVDLTGGDFHIRPDSPCVDAGRDASAFGTEDMDGQPRIQGPSVDIGADETMPATGYTLDDARRALGIAAGLWSLEPSASARLNVCEEGAGPAGISLQDAILLARIAVGLSPAP